MQATSTGAVGEGARIAPIEAVAVVASERAGEPFFGRGDQSRISLRRDIRAWQAMMFHPKIYLPTGSAQTSHQEANINRIKLL